MKRERDLILFTASFPFGHGETFLEIEIQYLSERFINVYVIPQQINFKERRVLPANCKVITDHLTPNENKNISFKNYLLILPILFKEWKINPFSKKSLTYSFSHLKSLLLKSLVLKKWYSDHIFNDPINYTYWFNDSATILNIISKLGKKLSFISRAHGFDIFEERHENYRIPYREFQFTCLKKVFSVSEMGKNYLQNKYPRQKLKIDVSYLGSKDYGFNETTEFANEFLIVSCSSIIALKRLDLIVDLLIEIDLTIKWIHFGDGPLKMDLLEKLKNSPKSFNFELKGHVQNDELCSYYSSNHIDLFLSVSETEGLPYSIMEAMSFGIPTIATDVGGVKEIVTSNSGYLIEKDFDVKYTADIITDLLQNKSRDSNFRTGIRNHWEEKFSAKNNYHEFVEILANTQ